MVLEELDQIAAAERENRAGFPHHIHVCTAAGCLSAGSDKVKDALVKEAGECCKVKGGGCMGLCSAGPLVAVEPDGVLYGNVQPEDAAELVQSVKDKQVVERLRCDTTAPFFTRQKKIVLENSGRIDPERIEDYIA